jgi:preprotein translocase subunit SecG
MRSGIGSKEWCDRCLALPLLLGIFPVPMSILITALLTVWAIVAVVMTLVILMQRPKSEGLGAAFGGGVTENIFGAQTTNVLVKFTTYLASFFFLLTFILSILYAHQSSTKSVLREELLKREATSGASPAATQSPATSASVVPGASPQASMQPPSSTPAASTAPGATAASQPSPKKP